MTRIAESRHIADVQFVMPQWFEDNRGRFCESFRKAWFPQRTWEAMQCNRSESAQHVLRGLHYHFRQVDYWQVLDGTIEIGLVDLRPSSPTYLQSELLQVAGDTGRGVYIPPGVAHGFYSMTRAVVMYIVDQYYDGRDELGVQWNDPDLGVAWSCASPILSARDRANPRWRDISPPQRPQ